MKLNEYQDQAVETAIYPKDGPVPTYPYYGLAEEAGEVLGKMAKYTRDGWSTDRLREEAKKELGDVLWNVACIARDLGLTMEEVAMGNLIKLASRKAAGTISGSGDNR